MLNSLQTLLFDNRHSSTINVISISCGQLTKNRYPHFSTSDNKFRQFIATPRVVCYSQIKAGQIMILSYDSLWNWKLKVVVATWGWTPDPPLDTPLRQKYLIMIWLHKRLSLVIVTRQIANESPSFSIVCNLTTFYQKLRWYGIFSCNWGIRTCMDYDFKNEGLKVFVPIFLSFPYIVLKVTGTLYLIL